MRERGQGEKSWSGSFSKGKKVCKESGNLKLEREFQVRGVAYCVFNS